MEREKRFLRPGLPAALIVFAVVIICMLYVFSYAQTYLGMWGLLITEIGLLMITYVGMVLFNVEFKQAFPLRKLKINQVAGVVLLWLGSFLAVMVVDLVIFYFYPEGLGSGVELNNFTRQWPIIPAVLLVSVTPAICEEALHRGFIQCCVKKSVKNKWLTCIIVGLLFGINHLDLSRLFATAFIGGVMAYVLIETDNFFYNMMFHFMNNFIIEMVSQLSGPVTTDINMQDVTAILPMSIASYLIIGCIAPELLLGGAMLIKGINRLKTWSRVKLIVSIVTTVLISIAMFFAGVMMIIYLISTGEFDRIMGELDIPMLIWRG